MEQGHSAMKVNTDGVLLGAWMDILPTDRVLLDVGTGSGVIALMAAQRVAGIFGQGKTLCEVSACGVNECDGDSAEREIVGIDIDPGSVEDASMNFEKFESGEICKITGCKLKMTACLCAVQNLEQHFPGKRYDLIFSNPPYFINALKSADDAKSNARHTDMLSQGEMIRSALQLLNYGGRLALILPSVEAEEFVRKTEFLVGAAKEGDRVLRLRRICKVHTLKSKPPKRWMLEFVLSDTAVENVEQTRLAIHENGEYTAGYRDITGDFYLNF